MRWIVQALFLSLIGCALYPISTSKNIERKVAQFPSVQCAEESQPATADDSSEKRYFEDLLARGITAPLSDFFHLWYPNRYRPVSSDPYFFKCAERPWTGPTAKEFHGVLAPECAPDVLYSWGPMIKLEAMKRAMPDGRPWLPQPNPGAITKALGSIRDSVFATISPISTYCYGEIPVRIKIKKSTRYRDGWSETSKGEINFTGGLSYPHIDYIISDSTTVESWSYGNPEFYDEIVRDALKILSGAQAIVYNSYAPRGEGVDRLVRLCGNFDPQIKMGEDVLKLRLLQMIEMILKREGKIHYSFGACRNRAEHFSTDKPTYINPYRK